MDIIPAHLARAGLVQALSCDILMAAHRDLLRMGAARMKKTASSLATKFETHTSRIRMLAGSIPFQLHEEMDIREHSVQSGLGNGDNNDLCYGTVGNMVSG
jgi:hypothetical protein